MQPPEPSELTRILTSVGEGDENAAARLLPLVYDELRRLARRRMANEPPDHTLLPTALVHEAYLRLLGTTPDWRDRSHFLATAARAMRSILVDCARSRLALKRGGDRVRVSLDPDAQAGGRPWEEILAVHEALDRLHALDPESGRVVELRFFGGLTFEETARVMGIAERSVYRSWEYARMWLFREIGA